MEEYKTYDPKPKESIYESIIAQSDYFQEKIRRINRKVEIIPEDVEKDSVIDLNEVESYSTKDTAYSENLSSRQSTRGLEKYSKWNMDDFSQCRESISSSKLDL